MKTIIKIKTVTLLLVLTILAANLNARIYYVKSDAQGAGDGSNWANAFIDVQDALDVAVETDEIWIAQGEYFPTKFLGGLSAQNVGIILDKNIRIIGGFEGKTGTEGDVSLADLKAFPTIISGDIGIPGDNTDNAFHIFIIKKVSSACTLENLILENANGNNASGIDALGQGIFIDARGVETSPTITNCIIRNHLSANSGVGVSILIENAGKFASRFTNVSFLNNEGSGGGGIELIGQDNGIIDPTFVSCIFKGNTARTAQGSAISAICHSCTSTPKFINCVVTGNHCPFNQAINFFSTGTAVLKPEFYNCTIAGNSGGGIRVAGNTATEPVVKVRNSIVWQDNAPGLSMGSGTDDVSHSVLLNRTDNNNIGLNPDFVDNPKKENAPHLEGDVRLKISSLAIDNGNNSDVPSGIISDADGNPRFLKKNSSNTGTVDMGAYEFQKITTATEEIENINVRVFPNPTNQFLNIEWPITEHYSKLTIYNKIGQSILHQDIDKSNNKLTIDLNSLYVGNYFIVLKGATVAVKQVSIY